MYTDKQLTCVECGAAFTFTAAEQERHAQLGFTNEPKRCAPCRAAKKAAIPTKAPTISATPIRNSPTAISLANQTYEPESIRP